MEHKKNFDVNIQDYLPHRNPMLMVDTVLNINKDKAETKFLIKKENIFVYENEFSEAGLIENIAQTCSAIVGQKFFEDENSEVKLIGFITNIKKINVYHLPKVGEEIITKAKLVSQYENICNIVCQTFLGENLLIDAEINLFIKEIEP